MKWPHNLAVFLRINSDREVVRDDDAFRRHHALMQSCRGCSGVKFVELCRRFGMPARPRLPDRERRAGRLRLWHFSVFVWTVHV